MTEYIQNLAKHSTGIPKLLSRISDTGYPCCTARTECNLGFFGTCKTVQQGHWIDSVVRYWKF